MHLVKEFNIKKHFNFLAYLKPELQDFPSLCLIEKKPLNDSDLDRTMPKVETIQAIFI